VTTRAPVNESISLYPSPFVRYVVLKHPQAKITRSPCQTDTNRK